MPLTTASAHRKDINTGLADMQHRHSATIAAIIRDMRNDNTESNFQADRVARHFAAGLAKTNPKFNAERFLAACK